MPEASRFSEVTSPTFLPSLLNTAFLIHAFACASVRTSPSFVTVVVDAAGGAIFSAVSGLLAGGLAGDVV